MKFEKLIVAAAVLSLLVAASLFAAPKVVANAKANVAVDDAKHEITAKELKERLDKAFRRLLSRSRTKV